MLYKSIFSFDSCWNRGFGFLFLICVVRNLCNKSFFSFDVRRWGLFRVVWWGLSLLLYLVFILWILHDHLRHIASIIIDEPQFG